MESLLYVGITHAMFVALFMACKQPKTLSDKIIAVWMVFLACPMLTRLCSLAYPNALFSGVYSIRSFPLTFGPFLWMYTNSLIGKKWGITKRDLWHFLPFFIFALVQIVFPQHFAFPRVDTPPSSVLQQIHGMATLFSLLGYSGMVLWRLTQHGRRVLDHFSSVSLPITLTWLQWLNIVFVTAYMMPVLAHLLRLHQIFSAHGLAFTGFIFALSFFALQQPIVFQKSDTSDESPAPAPQESSQEGEHPAEESAEENSEPKYGRSGLTEDRAQDYLQRLEDAMRHEKPYLDADLTLEKLAKQIHVSRNHLTQILNEQLNKNFYLYVNEYRINEVKHRLLDPDNAHLTILAIAYESGFNSKSTFNTVFKKITDMTPSQFRKSQVHS